MTQRRLRLTILIVALCAAANPLLAGKLDGSGAGRGALNALFSIGSGR